MKAITIWQPWASLLAIGVKQYETRGWKTNYRGPIAIHASMKNPISIMKTLPVETQRVMFDCLYKHYGQTGGALQKLQTGAIIAIGELTNVWYIVHHPGTNVDIAKHIPVGAELDVPKKHPDFGRYIVPTEKEMLFGDWTPGRYAWELANVELLTKPIRAKGAQRLWNWDEKDLDDQPLFV